MLFALRDLGSRAAPAFKRYVPSVACWLHVEPQVARHAVAASDVQLVVDSITSVGYRLSSIDAYEVERTDSPRIPHREPPIPGGSTFFNLLFTRGDDAAWFARWGMTS